MRPTHQPLILLAINHGEHKNQDQKELDKGEGEGDGGAGAGGGRKGEMDGEGLNIQPFL